MSQQDLFQEKDEESLLAAFEWWEKRRLRYNLVVGISGLLFLLLHDPASFYLSDILAIIFFGIAANMAYFLGFLTEVCLRYYFKMTYSFAGRRSTLFWMGTLFSVGVVFCINVIMILLS